MGDINGMTDMIVCRTNNLDWCRVVGSRFLYNFAWVHR